jgi:hypothetical protein
VVILILYNIGRLQADHCFRFQVFEEFYCSHTTPIMIDPMANLDAPTAVGAPENEKDVLDITTLRYNAQSIDKVRSVMGIASGCLAGICGLTGWAGLGRSCQI